MYNMYTETCQYSINTGIHPPFNTYASSGMQNCPVYNASKILEYC